VIAAVQDQLGKMPLSSKIFFNKRLLIWANFLLRSRPTIEIQLRLQQRRRGGRGCLKVARMYTKRTEFIATIAGFHGKSLGDSARPGEIHIASPSRR